MALIYIKDPALRPQLDTLDVDDEHLNSSKHTQTTSLRHIAESCQWIAEKIRQGFKFSMACVKISWFCGRKCRDDGQLTVTWPRIKSTSSAPHFSTISVLTLVTDWRGLGERTGRKEENDGSSGGGQEQHLRGVGLWRVQLQQLSWRRHSHGEHDDWHKKYSRTDLALILSSKSQRFSQTLPIWRSFMVLLEYICSAHESPENWQRARGLLESTSKEFLSWVSSIFC